MPRKPQTICHTTALLIPIAKTIRHITNAVSIQETMSYIRDGNVVHGKYYNSHCTRNTCQLTNFLFDACSYGSC